MRGKRSKGRISLGIFLLPAVFIVLLFGTGRVVHAQEKLTVRYLSSQGEYYLYDSSNTRVTQNGLYDLTGKKANKKTFKGIYYVTAKGVIRTKQGVCYVNRKKISGKQYYAGYYYFTKDGSLP